MGVHEHRLGVGVAYDANSGIAFELVEFAFESGSEVCAFEIVDGAAESMFFTIGCHSSAASAEM
jgi:hypothetical protein